MHLRPAACLAVGSAVLAAACSGSGVPPEWTFTTEAATIQAAPSDRPEAPTGRGTASPSPVASPSAGPTDIPLTAVASATATVRIADFAFGPDAVTIAAGGRVTWTNADDDRHSVQIGGAESDRLETGATFSRSFPSAGTFSYLCGLHPSMTGTVVVSEGVAGPATTHEPEFGTTRDPAATASSTAAPAASPTASPDDDDHDDDDDDRDDDHSGRGGGDDDEGHDEGDDDHSGPGSGGSGPG